MRLKQGQIWVKGDSHYRITEWSRLFITYKLSYSVNGVEEETTKLSKKEFCRLIKGAKLLAEDQK